MFGTFRRVKSEFRSSRNERRMIRDFHAASPRLREDLSVALRRG